VTTTTAPYRSAAATGRVGFLQSLRAEWTKFRTVRGWVVGTVVAAVLMVLFGLFGAAGSRSVAGGGPGGGRANAPVGPGGDAVTDSFYFVHQPLAGDGTITVRVTSLTASVITPPGGPSPDGGGVAGADAVQPWTKAGLIIKQSTAQGSAYAAVMVTGGHGVRMQDDFTNDTAGPAGAVSATSPRWLRLTRAGDTVTGYASTDGRTWTTVGTAHLAGLPSTVQAGLFVASPDQQRFEQDLGRSSTTGESTVATAAFDGVDLLGRYPDQAWSGSQVSGDPRDGSPGTAGFRESGGTFTVSGSGDIAPNVDLTGHTIERTLVGAFAALTVMAVIGVLFITTEYRRGMIRTSLAASPRRGRVLAAKALVIGAVTFVTGLVAAAATVALSELVMGSDAYYPMSWPTELRIIAGTGALLAVAAVLAVAVGTILRRSAATVATVIVLTVLPYILAVSAVLPAAPAQWLLRLTPAAAFAIQQSARAYPQVDQAYTPAFGFYPLGPWSGLAVLCCWTAAALGLAAYLLRRRDA
jgi:ABC-type transport system involved in multi-copper enzyme maturation permease subunit